MSDPRAAQARREHELAAEDEASADQHRAVRDVLVRALRADDWTYPQIAEAVGCSPELVAHIIKRKAEK